MQFLTIPEASDESQASSRRSSYAESKMKRPSIALLFDNQPARCRRCNQTVYKKEMVGPINGGIYHISCFKCKECGLKLSLQAYHTNEIDTEDEFVYCRKHVPKHVASGVGIDAFNVRTAIRSQANLKDIPRPLGMSSHIGADASFIKSSMEAQKMRENSKLTYSKHHYNPMIMKKHEESLLNAKRDLELKHRKEEEKLLTAIQERRKSEIERVDRVAQEEWEKKLKELTDRFDKMTEKKKVKAEERNKMNSQFENEKAELSKSIQIKKSKERTTLSSTMLPQERAMTSELIKRQSEEMLKMIASKDQELQTVISIDIGENGGAGQPKAVITKTFGETGTMTDDLPGDEQEANKTTNLDYTVTIEGEASEEAQSPMVAVIQPALRVTTLDEPPGPTPPRVLKRELYEDPDEIFAELDEEVINIAEEDQSSFTDLTYQLTKSSHSELEKVRAIFRWITVKDLSVMDLETIISNPDTPLGILRGIKIGTETYHVLFMRLCSYAGIHCREIKGYSKSVGYEPGMSFEKYNFTNTWNAVYVDGDWRLVQCNWAARHLVFHRDMDINTNKEQAASVGKTSSTSGSVSNGEASNLTKKRGDKLRYQYDEHYFLCDPDQFISEFFPFEPKWQLLHQPLTLEEFGMRPFVRSAFYQFGMRFPKDTKCILEADLEGKAQVVILMDDPQSVVCHYQLRYAEDRLRRFTYFEGQKLDRFVVFQVLDDRLIFDIHLPTHAAAFYFEVFAAPVDNEEPVPHQQIKLKCVCKFRIHCRRPIVRRLNPLPPSASLSGEWGPSKAIRHFAIKPLSHGQAVISETDRFSVQFWVPDKYLGSIFSASLHANHTNSHLMCKCVVISLEGNILTLVISPPCSDQYSLDLFMHRPGANLTLPPSHVCKYLLNCTTSQQIALCVPDSIVRDHRLKPGPTPLMKKLGAVFEGDVKPRTATVEDHTTITLCLRSAQELDFAYRYHLVQGDTTEDHTDLIDLTAEDGDCFAFKLPHIVNGHFLFYLCGRKRPTGGQPPFELMYFLKIEKESRGSTHS